MSEAIHERPITTRDTRAIAILLTVARFYGVSPETLCGRFGRYRRYTNPRQVCAFLLRELTDLSWPEIDACMGGFNHSRAINRVNSLLGRLETDHALRHRVNEIRKACESTISMKG